MTHDCLEISHPQNMSFVLKLFMSTFFQHTELCHCKISGLVHYNNTKYITYHFDSGCSCSQKHKCNDIDWFHWCSWHHWNMDHSHIHQFLIVKSIVITCSNPLPTEVCTILTVCVIVTRHTNTVVCIDIVDTGCPIGARGAFTLIDLWKKHPST